MNLFSDDESETEILISSIYYKFKFK